MLPVVVRVENLDTKSSVQHVFHRSPVHIGRNKLNELVLADGFVSLWHGILRFGDNSLEYLDLDSTNGTEVDGSRVRRNVFVPITEQTDLRIGRLRLHFARSEAAEAEPKPDLTLFTQLTARLGLQMTRPGFASAQTALPGPAPVLSKGTMPATTRAAAAEQRSAEAGIDSLSTFYESYREAWRALQAQLTTNLATVPVQKRGPTLERWRQRFPALPQEQEFRALESLDSKSAPEQLDAALALLRVFAQTYAPESSGLSSGEDVQRFLDQLAAVLEAYSKAFLELRRGHDQFGKEIAVPIVGDPTPLRHARTPRDLLRYLLDSHEEGAERIQQLTEGFAGVMIHQVALLNAMRQGIGALLAALGPEEIERSTGLDRKGVAALMLKARPLRAMALWPQYLARHQELLQDERAVHSVVFGSEFAFAYAQIVGGSVAAPRPGGTNGQAPGPADDQIAPD